MTPDLAVLGVGVLLMAAGAALVFPPAGLLVAGVMLVAVSWPEGGDGA